MWINSSGPLGIYPSETCNRNVSFSILCSSEGFWFTAPRRKKLNDVWKIRELEEAALDLITDGSFWKVTHIP